MTKAVPRCLLSICCLITLCLLFAAAATATVAPVPLNKRVLVVFNRTDGGSREVAKYYAKVRDIPQENLCSIAPIDPVMLSWKEYLSQVRAPIEKCLNKVGPKNILYIVFSYQTPFRVRTPNQKSDFTYSVDQCVADIWDQYVQPDSPGRRLQPYYDDAKSKENLYLPFLSFADYRAEPSAMLIYSVWRLDAATPKLAKGLVDKAMAAEASGLKGEVCIDRRWPLHTIDDSGYGAGDWDLHQAATFAREAGFKVIEDENNVEFGTPPAPNCPNAALYAGWYSLNHYNDAFTWEPGAIGIHMDSLSALNPRSGPNWSANAILHGIAVTTGVVDEPGLAGLVRPGGTFRDLFQGANLGDAFLRNTRFLKWVVLYIGDPLYRPFPQGLPPFNGKAKPAPQHTKSKQ